MLILTACLALMASDVDAALRCTFNNPNLPPVAIGDTSTPDSSASGRRCYLLAPLLERGDLVPCGGGEVLSDGARK